MAIVQIALLLEMAADDQSKDLSYIINKGAVNIVEDYFKLLDSVDALMSKSNMNVQQISQAAGITEWQLYRRKNKPELWTKEELINLFKGLDLNIGHEQSKDISTQQKSPEPAAKIIGPRADGKTVADFRALKTGLNEKGYPVKATREMVTQYLAPIRESIMKEVDRNTLLITVPSGSGKNKIPILFARQLARDTGATVLPEGWIAKIHKGEAKLNLSLEKRVHDPISYQPVDVKELKAFTSKFQRVVIVDDLLNSGESSVRLRKTLEHHGIKVHAFTNLVNVEIRYPSPADLDRVYKKISQLANLTMADKVKLKNDLPSVFQDYTKQKLNYIERSIRDTKSAVAAFKTISKAAQLESKLAKSIDQGMSL